MVTLFIVPSVMAIAVFVVLFVFERFTGKQNFNKENQGIQA
jgi:hypothetical protein